MLAALGSITAQQATPTKIKTMQKKQFSDYATMHPDAIVTYQARDMILSVHSDASYLSESKSTQ